MVFHPESRDGEVGGLVLPSAKYAHGESPVHGNYSGVSWKGLEASTVSKQVPTNPRGTFSNNQVSLGQGMLPSNSFYSFAPYSIESSFSNHLDQWSVPKFSLVSFEGMPCLLNVNYHLSLVDGDDVVIENDECSEGLNLRQNSKVKGVNRFIEKMGLKVVDWKEEPVLLSEYMDDTTTDRMDKPKQNASKGKREL